MVIGGWNGLTFDVNGKHLKISCNHDTYMLPRNHRRFLQPKIRKEIGNVFIEMYDIHNNEHDTITDEELLEVFEELYWDDIIWADAKKENLVRLVTDNTSPEYIRQRDDTIFGFEEHTENIGEPLKKGEVAICDLDLAYSRFDPRYINGIYIRGEMPTIIMELKDRLDEEYKRRQEEKERNKYDGSR